MPEVPFFPSEDDDNEERPPDRERIIDRIINGQLSPSGASVPPVPSAD